MRHLRCICDADENIFYFKTCKNCLEQYVDSATIFKNCFRRLKAISRPTKTDVGRQSILMVCEKIITTCFSFFLFKLLNKFKVMPQASKKFHGTAKNIGRASYLPRLMAWTVWLTFTFPNVRAIGNKFLWQIIFRYLYTISNILKQTSYYNKTYLFDCNDILSLSRDCFYIWKAF